LKLEVALANTETQLSDVKSCELARIALSLSFFMWGVGFALWAVHIPIIAARLMVDPAVLGLALLNIGFGALISQPISAWLVSRIGSKKTLSISMPAFMLAIMAPILAWSTPVLFIATFLLGLAVGINNVAINTQGSEIEKRRELPTMSSFHGFFSLGELGGAALGSAIFALRLQDGRGAGVLAAVMIATSLFAARFYLENIAPVVANQKTDVKRRFMIPGGGILGLVVLTFFSNTVEGAVNDWSTLYLATVRGFSETFSTSGFAAFALAMAVCRLAGGPVVARLGEKRILVYGGVLMAAGVGVVVFSPWSLLSPLGFALVAIGAANTIPVMMSTAARTPGVEPSIGIAAVATGALLGFLIGPPTIGFVAHAWGLAVALGLLSLAGVIIVVGALLRRWPESVSRPSSLKKRGDSF
jgi:MFS family permease